jgi:succinate-semialdehyde dehydrogenase/glutarate-semialdehyde dehydrogenase
MSYETPALMIDNLWRKGRGRAGVPVVNPATEEVLGEIAFASGDDVADALASAERGFAEWRKVGPWARSDMLRGIAALIRERTPEIARLLTLEVGKPIGESELEVISAAEHFEWAADQARQLSGASVSSRAPGGRGRISHEPVGVVLALTAWNFPINLPARKICMALAAGCSVILRPAEEAPACVAALIRCCVDAGLPEGAVTLLFGTPEEVIAPLMAAPAVRKVSFTGSTRVGKILVRQSADTVKRLTMELGGHAPVLVLEDADVAQAAETAALAKFRNAGQVCVAPSRFYVHERLADEFTDGFVRVAKRLKLGNGLDRSVTMGPMATIRQRDRAEALVADARQRGAVILCGGGRPAGINAGYFFEPTVMTNLHPDSEILHEEPFAPVAPIMTFSDTEEAIGHANALEAGLASYVFTRSLSSATLVSERIEAGMVGINTCGVAIPEGPFGGVKQSGYGREGGPTAIHDYLNIKFTHTRLL